MHVLVAFCADELTHLDRLVAVSAHAFVSGSEAHDSPPRAARAMRSQYP